MSLKRRVAKVEADRRPKDFPPLKLEFWHEGDPEPVKAENVLVVRFVSPKPIEGQP